MEPKEGEATAHAGTAWKVFEGVCAALAISAALGVFAMRDTVRDGDTFRTGARVTHEKTDRRLEHLERPELLIQLAQATDAAEDLKETARIARANATSIGLIQQEQKHARKDAAQRDGMLRQLLDHEGIRPKPVTVPEERPD